ncbi:hypothetical protein SDJN03_03824, partial [Cucurbita argyrosperma subsp. sororia]
MLVFEMTNYGVIKGVRTAIRGMQWLQTLGLPKVDNKGLALAIRIGDSRILIEDDPSLTQKEALIESLKRSWKQRGPSTWSSKKIIEQVEDFNFLNAIPPSNLPSEVDKL